MVVGRPTETDRPEGVKFVFVARHASDEACRKDPTGGAINSPVHENGQVFGEMFGSWSLAVYAGLIYLQETVEDLSELRGEAK